MRRKTAVALMAVMLVILSAGAVLADDSGQMKSGFPQVTVTIPVKHIIRGTGKGNTEAVFLLRGENDDTPMPEGSDGRSKEITLKGGGDTDFGQIEYDAPGVFSYEVSRTSPANTTKGRQDPVYRITVAVYNDGEHSMVIWKDAGKKEGKSDDIVFEDAASRSPKTGDALNALILFTLAAVMIICICIVTLIIGSRREEETIDERTY